MVDSNSCSWISFPVFHPLILFSLVNLFTHIWGPILGKFIKTLVTRYILWNTSFICLNLLSLQISPNDWSYPLGFLSKAQGFRWEALPAMGNLVMVIWVRPIKVFYTRLLGAFFYLGQIVPYPHLLQLLPGNKRLRTQSLLRPKIAFTLH